MSVTRAHSTPWLGLCALACLVSTLPVASAWWAAGHMTVAAVAATQLTPKAQTAVQNLLAYDVSSYPYESTVPSVADWMDLIKSGTDAFSSWHYADAPLVLNATGGMQTAPSWTPSSAASLVSSGDAPNLLWALSRCMSALAPGSRSAPSMKAFFLRSLFHLMGDLHQPCHTAAATLPDGTLDSGCNRIGLSPVVTVAPQSTASNLHAFWDAGGGALGAVPAPYPAVPAGSPGVSDADVARFVGSLAPEMAAARAAVPTMTAAQLTDRNAGLVTSWFTEGVSAAISAAYTANSPVTAALQAAATRGASFGSVVVDTTSPAWPAYMAAAGAVSRRRLALGGIRLGTALNALLTYDVPAPTCASVATPPPAPPPMTCPPQATGGSGGSGGVVAAAVLGWLAAIIAAGCALVPRLRGQASAGTAAQESEHAELLPAVPAGQRRMSVGQQQSAAVGENLS